MRKLILLFSLSLLLQGCPNNPFKNNFVGEISMINKSDEDIYFYFTETEMRDVKVSDIYRFDNRLFVKSKSEIPYGFRIKLYDNTPLYYEKKRRLYIFIWKQITIDKYSWEEIQEKNIYDEKFVYTFEELKAKKFMIVYDGK